MWILTCFKPARWTAFGGTHGPAAAGPGRPGIESAAAGWAEGTLGNMPLDAPTPPEPSPTLAAGHPTSLPPASPPAFLDNHHEPHAASTTTTAAYKQVASGPHRRSTLRSTGISERTPGRSPYSAPLTRFAPPDKEQPLLRVSQAIGAYPTSSQQLRKVRSKSHVRANTSNNLQTTMKSVSCGSTSGSARGSSPRESQGSMHLRQLCKELTNLKFIGQGARGTVYEAEWNGAPVAVKLIPTDCVQQLQARVSEAGHGRKAAHPQVLHTYECSVIPVGQALNMLAARDSGMSTGSLRSSGSAAAAAAALAQKLLLSSSVGAGSFLGCEEVEGEGLIEEVLSCLAEEIAEEAEVEMLFRGTLHGSETGDDDDDVVIEAEDDLLDTYPGASVSNNVFCVGISNVIEDPAGAPAPMYYSTSSIPLSSDADVPIESAGNVDRRPPSHRTSNLLRGHMSFNFSDFNAGLNAPMLSFSGHQDNKAGVYPAAAIIDEQTSRVRPTHSLPADWQHVQSAFAFGAQQPADRKAQQLGLASRSQQTAQQISMDRQFSCTRSDDGEQAVHSVDEVLRGMNLRAGQHLAVVLMEYCDRGNLYTALKKGTFRANPKWGAYTPMRALVRTAREIVQGLAHMHDLGIIHGSLKPSNILLKSSRQDVRGFSCRISDFRFSDPSEPDFAAGDPAKATTEYTAPEAALHDGAATTAGDIWSFGAILYEMYAGQAPVLSHGANGCMLVWPDDAPPMLKKIGEACTHPDPASRPTGTVASLSVIKFEQFVKDRTHCRRGLSGTGMSSGALA